MLNLMTAPVSKSWDMGNKTSEVRRSKGSPVCKNLFTNSETITEFCCFNRKYWISLLCFSSSGGPALKIDLILFWTSLHVLRNTSTNHCLQTQFVFKQMLIKALSCKKVICEHHSERLLCSLGQSPFKINWGNVKNCSVVRQIENWHLEKLHQCRKLGCIDTSHVQYT